MASLFKLRVVRYRNATGARVKKGSLNAKKVSEQSRKWYGEYRDAEGLLQRVPLCGDKTAARTMLNDLVRQVERRQAGLVDPFEEHEKKPITDHLADYLKHLKAKQDTETHIKQVKFRIQRIITACKFKTLSQINAHKIEIWLSDQRETLKRFSAQTSNFHLDSFKYFCNWLVTHERLGRNPLVSLKRISTETDRRHDRRSLSAEEFERLVQAAESGNVVEGISGKDRAMLYILATWTGYRRRELASLTLRSFDFEGDTPSVRVSASYSKRKRNDVIPLHEYVVGRVQAWLTSSTEVSLDESLFQLKTAKGWFRNTAKMMQKDLAAARQQWISEANCEPERVQRELSDTLKYVDENGLYADFHSNRHSFISRLSQAGVPLVIAQKLARHSDPRLTANRYTHLELHDKAGAISSLTAPTTVKSSLPIGGPEPKGSEADGEKSSSVVAVGVAGVDVVHQHQMASAVKSAGEPNADQAGESRPNSLKEKTFGNHCRQTSACVKVHPSGFEPETFGSVGRPGQGAPNPLKSLSHKSFRSPRNASRHFQNFHSLLRIPSFSKDSVTTSVTEQLYSSASMVFLYGSGRPFPGRPQHQTFL